MASLRARGDDPVDDGGEDIHALLPGQPADHAEQRASSCSRPKRSSSARLLAARPASVFALIGARPDGRRSPGSRSTTSMPLTMPVRVGRAQIEQPVEPHAEVRRADLLGIGGADRGDRARRLQPGLEEADAAIIFDAVERHGAAAAARAAERRSPETGPGRRGCAPSSPSGRAAAGHSADRRASSPPASHGRGRCRAGSPRRSSGEVRAGPRQRREAPPIVGPVLAGASP